MRFGVRPRAKGDLASRVGRARADVKERVGVEHSMALEHQAVGRVDEAVEAGTKRQLRRRGIR